MRWFVEGAEVETGRDTWTEVEAESPEAASSKARELGLLVSSVAPVKSAARRRGQGKGLGNIILGFGLASLLAAGIVLLIHSQHPFKEPLRGTSSKGDENATPAELNFINDVRFGDVEAVKSDFQFEPRMNAEDLGGRQAIHHAAQISDYSSAVAIIKMLVQKGADVNAAAGEKSLGETPLHAAVSSTSHPETIAELLISLGAKVDGRNAVGQTSLHCVAEAGNVQLINLLLSHGADPNARSGDGQTPLHLAAGAGQDAAVKVLIANHADLNARDDKQYSPLKRAHLSFRESTEALLRSAGASE